MTTTVSASYYDWKILYWAFADGKTVLRRRKHDSALPCPTEKPTYLLFLSSHKQLDVKISLQYQAQANSLFSA